MSMIDPNLKFKECFLGKADKNRFMDRGFNYISYLDMIIILKIYEKIIDPLGKVIDEP